MERSREKQCHRGAVTDERQGSRSDFSRDRDRGLSREKDRGGKDRDRGLSREKDRRGKDRDRNEDGGRGERVKGRHRPADGERVRRRSPDEDLPRSSAPTSPPQKQGRASSLSPLHGPSRTSATSPREEVTNHNEDFRLDDANDSLAKMKAIETDIEEKQKLKEKPSFEYSGKLAAETNKVRGVTLQFTEPPEARKPTVRWRLYIFKDGEPLNEPLYIHRLSCYLFGRERRVADVPTDHPSCSKQHAVIQYRLVEKDGVDAQSKSEVRPYLMDLNSTNGTFLNDEQIASERYYELFEKDTIKFGNSREYVLLHEQSAG